jgi:hypothetical protein
MLLFGERIVQFHILIPTPYASREGRVLYEEIEYAEG